MDQKIFFTLKNRLQNCIFLILSTTLAYQSLSKDSKFLACEPKSCGNGLSISYPFRLPDQESYCGYPNFDVTCQDNNTVLTISSDQYIIKDIFPGNHSLLVANAVAYNNSCPAPLNNVSLGLTPFNLVPGYLNFSFWYGCNSSPPGYAYPITCGGHTNATSFSFASFYIEDVELDSCPHLVNAPVYNSWVDFDLFSLNYTEILQRGFMLNWTASNCSTCASSGGRCGFENSEFVCFCLEGQSSSSCVNGKAAFNIGKWLIVESSCLHSILSAGVAVGAVILVSTVYCCMRRLSSYTGVAAFLRFLSCKSKDDNDIEAFLRNHGSLAPKRYSYSEVKKMTRSFKDRLGEGGYGSVFKGKLPNGCLVAVKVLKKSKGNGVEFINEVASISRTSHVNIVTLLGFCFDGSKRILIYEFMPNGSLDKYIYKENGAIAGHQLDCEKLYQIALGVARGLEYLHRDCNTRILHFDIKPQNILLDQNFCPKISDFGLAKICPERKSNISMKDARGTIEYIAPEVFCRNFGGVSHKSDVYSYGMLVLEIIGGRQSPRIAVDNTSEIYFPDWIHKRLELGEELGLPGINSEEENTVIKKMVLVSLWCIQTSPSNRPPMNRVVEMLQASLESLPIPPRPYLSSPPRAPEISVASFPILSSELLAS